MKVLWFSVTPSLYCENQHSHNGGGWIESLEKLVRKEPTIELGIVFEYTGNNTPTENKNVKYYPINPFSTKIAEIKRKYIYKEEERLLIPVCLKIIDDFKPDIIQVFGSEWCFGLVAQYTNVPVVIHIQGSTPPYYNALYPPGYSNYDNFFYYKFKIHKLIRDIKYRNFFEKRVEREIRIIKNCQYFMGRTEWDKNITKIYSPGSKYFYCSEALRDVFLQEETWQPHSRSCITIASTLSAPLYKGVDLVLKTAKLMKACGKYNFEWRLFGIKEIEYHEWKTHIKANDVNVNLCGKLSAEQLKKELLDADMFVHPSYIDNSPNSICEAQVLGLPVVATNVGGIPSLVEHNISGLLFPTNDPYTLFSHIVFLYENCELAKFLGTNARETALKRHDPQTLLKNLIQIYKQIVAYEYK